MAIITISGTPGSGKSTVGKMVAEKLRYKSYSSGDFMREMAEEKNIDFFDFIEMAEKDASIDEEIDQRQIMMGMSEDNFVIDARLGFHFIPHSIKVFIDADFEERAKRILADRIRKEHNVNLENTKENIKIREDNEQKRYQKYYQINPYDKSQFELIIDSTNKKPKEIAEEIIEYIKDKE